MAKIELENVSHSYGPTHVPEEKRDWAVKDMSICWEDGSANALLGPSGCGKTTLLNIISGLITAPTSGRMLVDGEDVTHRRPRERRIAQVFQFPVVYDTMSVFDNLAFPLRNERTDEGVVQKKVLEVAEILDLKDILYVPVPKLNPAEKQKISLGRGIVREDTAAVLLDEPLTVIDPKLKWNLRRKLRDVQRNLKKTMIYVTHDQHEALTFADNVTVIKEGKLIQNGSPANLYTEPESPFIGYFIGSPGMNVLDCTLKETSLDFGTFSFPLSRNLQDRLSSQGDRFQVGIRPEFIRTSKETREGWSSFSVTIIEDTGAYRVLTLDNQETRIKARVPENFSAKEEDLVWIQFPEENIKIFKDDKRVF
jgi:glycerol transport system ATP-binding protein